MIAKTFCSPPLFGLPTVLAVVALANAGGSAASAQEPSLTATEEPLGRRAAALYRISTTPLNLIEDKPPVSPQESERFRQTQRAFISSPFVLVAALAQPDVASLSVFRDSTDKIDWLQRRLRVTFPGGGDVMEIAVADTKAPKEDLLTLANAVSKAYFDEVVFREQGERTLPLQILQSSFRRLSGSLRDKSETLRQLEIDHGFDAASLAKRQWSTDEAWLLRQRIEELRTQRFDEKLRRLQTDQGRHDEASVKVAEEKWAAIDAHFTDEEKRLKARLDETLAAAAADASVSNTDLDLRRQEIEELQETTKLLSRRIQWLQIEMQAPNRVAAIGSMGSEGARADFYNQ